MTFTASVSAASVSLASPTLYLALTVRPDHTITEIFYLPKEEKKSLIGKNVEQLFLDIDCDTITACLTHPGEEAEVKFLLSDKRIVPLTLTAQPSTTPTTFLLTGQTLSLQSSQSRDVIFELHSMKNGLGRAGAHVIRLLESGDTAEMTRQLQLIQEALADTEASRRKAQSILGAPSPLSFLDAPFSPKEILQTLLESHLSIAHHDNPTLKFLPLDVPSDLPPLLTGNKGALKEIIANLLINAIRHTRPNTTVTLRCTAIPLKRKYQLTVAVIDTGQGVPDAEKWNIFQDRTRGAAATTTPGEGIGLAHSLQLAQSLPGGTLTVSDTPGGGATFTLTALFDDSIQQPTVSRRASAPPVIAPPRTPPPTARLVLKKNTPRHQIRLLLVDDNPSMDMKITAKLLIRHGLVDSNITRCSTFKEARQALEKEQMFDLIITDELLGKGDAERGHLLLPHLKKPVPFIVLTGSPEFVPLDSGVTDVVEKPLKTQEANALLKRWFGDGAAPA